MPLIQRKIYFCIQTLSEYVIHLVLTQRVPVECFGLAAWLIRNCLLLQWVSSFSVEFIPIACFGQPIAVPSRFFFSSDLLTLHPFPSTHKKSIPYSARDPFFFESQPSFFFAFCIPSSRFPWGWPIHSSISRSVVHAIGKNDAFKTVPLPVWLSRLLSKNKARFCSTLR